MMWLLMRPTQNGQPNLKRPACKQKTFPTFHGRFLKAFLFKAPEPQGEVVIEIVNPVEPHVGSLVVLSEGCVERSHQPASEK